LAILRITSRLRSKPHWRGVCTRGRT